MSTGAKRAGLVRDVDRDLQTFATRVYLFNQHVADKMRLHPTDFQCIHILDQEGPLTAGNLAKRVGLTTGAMTTAIDRLERGGYVQRRADASDRRRVVISLEGRNVETMRALFAPVESYMEGVWAELSDDELGAIAKFFRLATRMQ